MGQCYSGGFIGALNANNRVIATACKEDELSYARKDLTRDEFVYHWTGAATSYTLHTQATRDDGYISALETFNYAKQCDSQPETPQYSSLKEETGKNISLAGKIYRIDGPSSICYSRTGIFSISDPSITKVDWMIDYGILATNTSSHSITIRNQYEAMSSSFVNGLINFSDGEKFMAKSTVDLYNQDAVAITFEGELTAGMESSVTAYGVDHRTMKDFFWTFSDGSEPIVQGKDWTIVQVNSTSGGSDVEFYLSFTNACGEKQRVTGRLPCSFRGHL